MIPTLYDNFTVSIDLDGSDYDDNFYEYKFER